MTPSWTGWAHIAVVTPRYGKPDAVEMFAIDFEGGLWHRFSDPAGGWTKWERDDPPEDGSDNADAG